MDNWFVTLPPEGAARACALEFTGALSGLVGPSHVKVFDTGTYDQVFRRLLKEPDENMIVDLLDQSLFVQCLDFDASHCLVTALSPVTVFILNLLRKKGVVNIHWFYEDYRAVDYWREVLPGYHYFFGMQKGELERACRNSRVIYQFLPPAAQRAVTEAAPPIAPPRADVAFVGVATAYRARMLERVAASGKTLVIGGEGWDAYSGPLSPFIVRAGWVDPAQAVEFYRRGRVGINLSTMDPGRDRENAQISPRAYDILGLEIPLVTEDLALLPFSLPGLHYRTFTDADEMLDRIEFCLGNFESEKKRAAQNRQLVQSEHSWTSRARTIVEVMRK